MVLALTLDATWGSRTVGPIFLQLYFVGLLLAGAVGRSGALGEGTRLPSRLTHGWECIACRNNTMLAGDFGHVNSLIFNMSDTWWVDIIANRYAAVTMNNWLDSRSYNGTGESGLVTVAKALKAVNPNIKLLYYQSANRVSDTVFVQNQLFEHKDWWLKDDYGNIVWYSPPTSHSTGHPRLDFSIPAAQEWFAKLPLSFFTDKEEAKKYCDGLFVDGANYRDFSRNISATRYEKLFAGKMAAMHLAQEFFTELNGGEVWGNAALECHHSPNKPAYVNWNTTLQHFNWAFEEMFGSFSTENKDGSWNVTLMEKSFESVIAASNAGHGVVIHAFPGPATVPFTTRGEPGNSFNVPSWDGPVPVPATAELCREAAAKRLVESLAPFLIVANEHVFLSYAWFYGVQSGYIPCKPGVECGMPSTWYPEFYPEFTRPLGPPKGPAQREGTVWTREFEHASVYVDLKDRSASKITWS